MFGVQQCTKQLGYCYICLHRFSLNFSLVLYQLSKKNTKEKLGIQFIKLDTLLEYFQDSIDENGEKIRAFKGT